MFGPWKKIAEGYGKMVLGYFGRTPAPPDPEVVKICAEEMGLEPTTRKVLEINDEDPSKGIEAARKLLSDSGIDDFSDENIFIAATCGQKGIDFLLGKAEIGVRLKEKEADTPAKSDGGYTVTVNGKAYAVEINGDKAVVNGKNYDFSVAEGLSAAVDQPAGGARESADSTVVKAQLPGKVLKIVASVGDVLHERDVLLVVEAMKMEVEIKSPVSGILSAMSVDVGDQVQAGQELASIN
jgi:pyruvate carboxylase subunit B